MVTLWIDEQRCDIGPISTIPIAFDAAKLTQAEGARSGRTIELELPATPANRAILGASCDLLATKRFNMEHHSARIEKSGIEIFGGTAYLLETAINNGVVESYTLRISEGGAEWIDNLVSNKLSDLDIPFEAHLNLSDIATSWEGEQAVRFLPVYRGDYMPRLSYTTSLPVERVLLTDDYHPFISVAEMVKEMFAKSGYRLRSNFLDSELGRSLYISGDYSRTDNGAAKAKCDFFARRAEEGIAYADYTGRVYASNAFATHTVGPIVDTADPEAVDSSGSKMSDTFCRYNSFSKNDNGDICFTPRISVKAGFLLHLEYSTEYKILSRKQLCGFDTFEGINGERIEITLANNYYDYRNEAEANFQYRALVFDHIDNRQYQLLATLPNGVVVEVASWSGRSSLISTPAKRPLRLELQYRDSNSWIPYTGDWALYAGYIKEEGMVDVEMDFRIAPQEISAGESLVLDKFWFGGAEKDMQLIVGTGTSLRPYFSLVPGYNSKLEFKDIAPRNIRQIELLTALGEMFNLAFYTDRTLKELHIEPLEDLYNGAEIVDWSDRIDHLRDIAISDLGVDTPQNLVLTYITADYASQRFNNDNETTLGRWCFRNPLYGTNDSTKTLGNKLFTTTLNTSKIVGSAPYASIMQVGDSGNEEENIEVAFTPRIICYRGLQPLPDGESWGTSSRLDKYPYAAFVDETDTNLCFEERNGIEGLSRYYAPMLERQSNSRQIVLDLLLTTAEIATLFTNNGSKPSLRTLFRFNIQGESLIFRLRKIESWDIESNIVRCTFEQDLNH